VYYACVLQRIVGKLYNAEQVKEWLMVPGPESGTEEGTRGMQDGSLAAIFILSAPFAMVKVSIFSFLVGLAIYQGFIFTKNLDNNTAPGDSRDSFIALMVGTGLCTVFFLMTFSAKEIESTIRSRSSRLDESSPQHMFDTARETLQAAGEASLEKTSRTTLQLSSNIQEIVHEREPAKEQQRVIIPQDQQEIVHECEPASEQQRVISPQTQALARLLEAAAQAHVQCAEADRRVAVAFTNSLIDRSYI